MPCLAARMEAFHQRHTIQNTNIDNPCYGREPVQQNIQHALTLSTVDRQAHLSMRSRDLPTPPDPAISLIHTEVSRMQAGDCLVLFDGRSSTLAGLLQHFWRERRNRRQATRCLHSHSRAGGGLSGVYKDAIKSSLSETLGHSGQCSLHLIQVNQTWLLSPVGNLGLRFHPPSRIESACIGGAWPDSRILVVLE